MIFNKNSYLGFVIGLYLSWLLIFTIDTFNGSYSLGEFIFDFTFRLIITLITYLIYRI